VIIMDKSTFTSTTSLEKGISNFVGVLNDPIVAYPGGWADTLPEWLKHAIVTERMVMNLKSLQGEEITGTDAEACAYLYTACLCFPLDSDWANIYFYVTSQVYPRHHDGAQVPEDIRVESLTDYQMSELRRLKNSIYNTRIRGRQERDRAQRRQQREEVAARKKREQPELAFEF
jgi:hypothetical protein